MHDGYISWDDYESNQKRLRENAQVLAMNREQSPPREGPALLQGFVLCGVCGNRMTVRYHCRAMSGARLCLPKRRNRTWRAICQSVNGEQIDNTIGRLLVDTVTPLALDITLAVQHELQARMEQVDGLRRKQMERARYDVDLEQRRYRHCGSCPSARRRPFAVKASRDKGLLQAHSYNAKTNAACTSCP